MNNLLCDSLLGDLVYPVIASLITAIITTVITARIVFKDSIPKISVVTIDKVDELEIYPGIINDMKMYIYISFKERICDGRRIEETDEITYEILEYERVKEILDKIPLIFIRFVCRDNEELNLTHIVTKTGTFYSVKGGMVPKVINDSNNMLFICKEKNVPWKIQGKVNQKFVEYTCIDKRKKLIEGNSRAKVVTCKKRGKHE